MRRLMHRHEIAAELRGQEIAQCAAARKAARVWQWPSTRAQHLRDATLAEGAANALREVLFGHNAGGEGRQPAPERTA